MSNFQAIWLIARREAKERARSKAFLASTAVTVLLLGAVVTIVALTHSGPPRFDVALVGDSPAGLTETLNAAAIASNALIDYSDLEDREAIADAIALGDLDAAVLDDDTILLGPNPSAALQTILEIGLRQSRLIERLEDADHDEPFLTQPDHGGRCERLNTETLGGDRTKHDSGEARRCVVEEHANRNGSVDRVEQVGLGSHHRDATRLCLWYQVGAINVGVDIDYIRRRLHRTDATDHVDRFVREYGVASSDAGTSLNGEQVGAETLQLGEQLRLGGLAQSQHRNHGTDADHDPQGREGGSQRSGSGADRGRSSQVRRVELAPEISISHPMSCFGWSDAMSPSRS